MGLFAEASVAIDGSKFKAVNNRDKNFTRAKMQRRLAQIEESVARYLHQLDSADRQEPSLARTTKTACLKEKIAKLKEEMQRLEALDVRMLSLLGGPKSSPDGLRHRAERMKVATPTCPPSPCLRPYFQNLLTNTMPQEGRDAFKKRALVPLLDLMNKYKDSKLPVPDSNLPVIYAFDLINETMANKVTLKDGGPQGRINMAPSLQVARMICSNDTASAASAATYRFEARCRELQARFEQELQGVRDAYLAELAGLDLQEAD